MIGVTRYALDRSNRDLEPRTCFVGWSQYSTAAALSVKSPFSQGMGGANGAAVARDARADFVSPHGDPFTILRVFARWLQAGGRGVCGGV
jgi:hypothetical protein